MNDDKQEPIYVSYKTVATWTPAPSPFEVAPGVEVMTVAERAELVAVDEAMRQQMRDHLDRLLWDATMGTGLGRVKR